MRLPNLRSILPIIVLIGATLFLTSTGRLASNRTVSEARPRSLHSVVRVIHAPQALVDFARRFDVAAIASSDHLNRLVSTERLQGVWYGLTIRDYSSDGGFSDDTIIEYPGVQPGSYGRTRSVLYTLAGGREPWGGFDPTKVKVVVVPERLLGRDPATTLADLIEAAR